MSSGIASGVQSAPQYDAQKRPITAGGFVDQGTVVFQDVTKDAGLSGWVHKMGVLQKQFIVETNGSGVCLIDYNNDVHNPSSRAFDSVRWGSGRSRNAIAVPSPSAYQSISLRASLATGSVSRAA